jgi:CPA2 family monovalent cation:H+ antiporter-2
MPHADLILTLTLGLAAALAFGFVTQRLGLSPIVGYLLAGVAVGPQTPGFVANKGLADQLAEIGIILLMFGVGLQFHLKELMAVRRVALPGALAQIAVATALGALAAAAWGWSWTTGIVFGVAISVASTVVLIRVLADNRDLQSSSGRIAVGWLVVEDLFTILALVALPAFFDREAAQRSAPLTLGIAVVKIAALVVFTLVVGKRVLPRLLEYVAATRSRELFTLTVLVIALGIAVGSAELFGASMALGAFLAGMVVGQSEFSSRAASEALPMRDAFAVLFFVSVGMLFDPAHLLMFPGQVAITLAIILIGKPLAALTLVLALGYPGKVALSVAIALAQIGEFSFILSGLAQRLGLFTQGATSTLVAASIVSITLNPLLYRGIGRLERSARRHPRLASWLAGRRAQPLPDERAPGSAEAIVIGYGPVGQTVTRVLRDNGVRVAVIEMNLATARALREDGLEAVYGDALQREVLERAGVSAARGLFLTTPHVEAPADLVRIARELNPKLQIIARTSYLRDAQALREAGADAVLSGEGEVAFAMTELLLRALGATHEQLDQERHRVRQELAPTTTLS